MRSSFLEKTDPETANEVSGPQAVPQELTTQAQVTDGVVGKPWTSVDGFKALEAEQEVGNTNTDTQNDAKVVRMRVSSKHLSLASPVFAKMLHGPWKEAQAVRVGYGEIEMDWQNMDAMLILMNVIHGHGPNVPRRVSLETLTQIAILVDYYNCHKAIQLASDMWIQHFQASMSIDLLNNIVRWIWISWVFRHVERFRYATYRTVKESRGPISSLGLPIPQRIIDAIEKSREHCIKSTLAALRRLVTDLQGGRDFCSFECEAFRLGALKQLHGQGFLGPLDEGTIPSISLSQLHHLLVTIENPAWCDITLYPHGRYHDQHQHSDHSCTLQSLIQPILSNVTSHMREFGLEEFREKPQDGGEENQHRHTSRIEQIQTSYHTSRVARDWNEAMEA